MYLDGGTQNVATVSHAELGQDSDELFKLDFIETVPALQVLSVEQKRLVAGRLITCTFSEGENVVVEGEPATCLYILFDGQVRVRGLGSAKLANFR